MEILIISLAAFLTAILNFFSGFGLGIILTPVFMLFFPVDLAIALTGVVHFFNNIFKLFLVGGQADRGVLLRFGVPAVIAAVAGSWLLLQITDLASLFSYQMGGKTMEVFLVKFIIALLLIFFALLDLLPFFQKLQFGKEKLPLGGVLSGFFGGLSGHQGVAVTGFAGAGSGIHLILLKGEVLKNHPAPLHPPALFFIVAMHHLHGLPLPIHHRVILVHPIEQAAL